jgi:hypothetical protein
MGCERNNSAARSTASCVEQGNRSSIGVTNEERLINFRFPQEITEGIRLAMQPIGRPRTVRHRCRGAMPSALVDHHGNTGCPCNVGRSLSPLRYRPKAVV